MIQKEVFKYKNNIYLLIASIAIFWLPICQSKPQHISKPFKTLKYTPNHFEDYQQKVTLRAKRLQPQEVRRLLSNRATRLFRGRRKLIPIQLSFSNKGKIGWILSPQNITLPMVNYKHIYTRIKRHTGARVFGIFGCGTLGYAASIKGITAATSAFLFMQPWGLVACGTLCAINLGFLIGTPTIGITHGLGSAHTNDKILADIKAKSLHHDIILAPGSHYECLIFVEKKYYKNTFGLTLQNACDKHDTLNFTIVQ